MYVHEGDEERQLSDVFWSFFSLRKEDEHVHHIFFVFFLLPCGVEGNVKIMKIWAEFVVKFIFF